ncbi:unnamed protein product [Rotaria sordida]|uniref:Uncharacterized protein n=1 Tax=Rotaria sordida TaxID=392033 RepID=A0A813ZS09_9BILA|nr:unnamed protein product [Rotaria sordida]CAF0966103.1 unnamed protein product [Rotaria sordida]CAF3589506.1 unnamed protein product [Rotaria sordida]CAF3963436.1 unnamed protein product [Rotaria sordida]
MEENDNDENLPAKATDEDIRKELDSVTNENNTQDPFIYFKSSSIISILIIVIISLVGILTISLLIRTILHSYGITRRLSMYFGFTPNYTIDESTLTFWTPKNIYDKQSFETTTITVSSSSSHSTSSPAVILNNTEKKAQTIFRIIILPTIFLLSIPCGILAFYMRRRLHYYPAWGARPKKRAEPYIIMALK